MIIDHDFEANVKTKKHCIGVKFNRDKTNPSSTVKSFECHEKNSFVCSLEPDKVILTQKQTKFPCISNGKISRGKRNTNGQSHEGSASPEENEKMQGTVYIIYKVYSYTLLISFECKRQSF